MLKIDASLDETGQILRTGLSLAALTGCIVQVDKIAGGVRASHLPFIETLSRICYAEVDGAVFGSNKLIFKPHSIKAEDYHFDYTDNPNVSINLIFQTLLFPLVFADRSSFIYLKGKLNTPAAPSFDYIRDIYMPAITKMGVNCNYKLMSLNKTGFAQALLAVNPSDDLQPFVTPNDKPIDKFLADQLILPIALSKGSSSFVTEEVTQNLLSNISIVEKFLDVRFHISAPLGAKAIIEKLGDIN